MASDATPAWNPYGGDGNVAYLDKTLRHEPVELALDDGVNGRFVLSLWLRAAFASTLVWFLFTAVGVLVALIGGAGSDSSSRSGSGYGSSYGPNLLPGWLTTAMTLSLIGVLLGGAVFWLVLLVLRVPEPVAEWRVLLADRATDADSVYSQIAGTLRVRQSPIGGSVRRIRTGPGPRDVSNRLVLLEGPYTAYVSVFAYGTSLYLGWTMWRSRRGAELIGRFFLDLLGGLLGHSDPERRMMRTERARAMREAVHAACREGLFAGYERRYVPVEYGFPRGLPPVEDGDLAAAPVPGQPAAGPATP